MCAAGLVFPMPGCTRLARTVSRLLSGALRARSTWPFWTCTFRTSTFRTRAFWTCTRQGLASTAGLTRALAATGRRGAVGLSPIGTGLTARAGALARALRTFIRAFRALSGLSGLMVTTLMAPIWVPVGQPTTDQQARGERVKPTRPAAAGHPPTAIQARTILAIVAWRTKARR